MVQKSKGPRARTRYKMRSKGKPTVNSFFKKFEIGELVHIDFVSNIKGRGYPYVKFQGATGRVAERRGKAYVVNVSVGDATKKIIAQAVHLKGVGKGN